MLRAFFYLISISLFAVFMVGCASKSELTETQTQLTETQTQLTDNDVKLNDLESRLTKVENSSEVTQVEIEEFTMSLVDLNKANSNIESYIKNIESLMASNQIYLESLVDPSRIQEYFRELQIEYIEPELTTIAQEISTNKVNIGLESDKTDKLEEDISTVASGIANFNNVYLEASKSVFHIETSKGYGTGWLIEPGFILTAEHVISNSTGTIWVRQADPTLKPYYFKFTAVVVGENKYYDIALLKFSDKTIAECTNVTVESPKYNCMSPHTLPLSLEDTGPEYLASPVLSIGYSSQTVKANGTVGLPGANAGILSKLGVVMLIDAPLDSGDSGGPILSLSGKVLGMNIGHKYTNPAEKILSAGMFTALSSNKIGALLSDLKP